MALSMPRPLAHQTGVYYLNVRIPSDIVEKVRKTTVSLPVNGSFVTVKATDKIFLSLRTKDPVLAKQRFVEAFGALSRHFDACRAGPQTLPHKQIVALAGEIYTRWVRHYEEDPHYVPDGLRAEQKAFESAVADWYQGGEDEFGKITEEDARFLARVTGPMGPELLAFERKSDVETPLETVAYEDAIECLFGRWVDAHCSQRAIMIDGSTRRKLLREVSEACHLLNEKLRRNMQGDYSADPAATRFPPFEMKTSERGVPPPRPPETIGVMALFDRWSQYHGDKKAASTIRRYGPSLRSLGKFTQEKDVRILNEEDIWKWAEHRRDVDGIGAATVNRNDLVAANSVLGWATTRSGGKLRADNPAAAVKLDPPRKQVVRDRTFLHGEIAAILTLARAARADPKYPRASASRRWAPWICAYSGARIQEVCWLSKNDVWREGDVWVMRFPQTKDGHARTIPVHDQLVAEGLLTFCQNAPIGFLFVGDRPQKAGATRTPQEIRASETASWISDNVPLAEGVSPNHAWRHTFVTHAEAAGISKRMSNAITGHNKKKDASDGYFSPTVEQLKIEIDKFPPYKIPSKL